MRDAASDRARPQSLDTRWGRRLFSTRLFALSGACLIKAPLSAYRIHGANDHAQLPQLRGLRARNEGAYARNTAAKTLGLVTLLERSEAIIRIAQPPLGIFPRHQIVASSLHEAVLPRASVFSWPPIAQAMGKAYPSLVTIFGERHTIRQLRRMMKLRHPSPSCGSPITAACRSRRSAVYGARPCARGGVLVRSALANEAADRRSRVSGRCDP